MKQKGLAKTLASMYFVDNCTDFFLLDFYIIGTRNNFYVFKMS